MILFLLYYKNKKKIIFKLLTVNILLLMLISFLPIGNIGLKYLENNFIYKKHYKNIDNIIVLSGSNYRLIESVKLGNKFKNAKVYYIGGNAYLIKKKINDEVSKAKKIYEDLNFDMTRVKFVGRLHFIQH